MSSDPTPKEPNGLTDEQNAILNQQADALIRLLNDNLGTDVGKTLLTAIILLAYSADEEWVSALNAADSMIACGYKGSVKEAVEDYMPKRGNHE